MFPRLFAAVALLLFARCSGEQETALGNDHDHDHAHSLHDGVVAKLNDPDGKAVGYVELKLHDDKGDLECWLAKDEDIRQAMALPLDQIIHVRFPVLDKSVTLAVRNADQNEDEDGEGNVTDGKTHYFIYPTKEEQDASWLMGEDFSSNCTVQFELGGKSYTSEEFTLVPHGAHDHEHDH